MKNEQHDDTIPRAGSSAKRSRCLEDQQQEKLRKGFASAAAQFKRTFLDRVFGCLCAVRDHLWFANDLMYAANV